VEGRLNFSADIDYSLTNESIFRQVVGDFTYLARMGSSTSHTMDTRPFHFVVASKADFWSAIERACSVENRHHNAAL
jgi:hypothetical protein